MKLRTILAVVILIACLFADQATKQIANKHLSKYHKTSYLNDTLRLQYAENKGAAFSLGSGLSEKTRWLIFGWGQGLFLLMLAIYLIKQRKEDAFQFYGFVLILSGGLGNFLDRIYRDGVVVDFLNIGFGSIRTAIFNVADIAITVGLSFLILGMILHSRKPQEEQLQSLDKAEDEIVITDPPAQEGAL